MTRYPVVVAATMALSLLGASSAADHPFARSRLGDLAWYASTLSGPGRAPVKQISRKVVVSKTDTEVVIDELSRDNHRDYDKRRTIDLTQPYRPILGTGTVREVGQGVEPVVAGGRRYEATWVAYESEMNVLGLRAHAKIRIWYSPAAPLDGMVRRETLTEGPGGPSRFITELAESGTDGHGPKHEPPSAAREGRGN